MEQTSISVVRQATTYTPSTCTSNYNSIAKCTV